MADVKISALPAASTPLTGAEVLPIVQSSVTTKVAVSNLTAGLAGTASININGTVGATTPSTGAFTSGTFSTTLGVTGTSTLAAVNASGVATFTAAGGVVLNRTNANTALIWQNNTVEKLRITNRGDASDAIQFSVANATVDVLTFTQAGAVTIPGTLGVTGNVGINTTLAAWSGRSVLQVANGGVNYGPTAANGGSTGFFNNGYWNGSADKAIITGYSQIVACNDNNSGRVIILTTSGTSSADATISYTAGPYVSAGGTSWTSSSDERLKNITGEIKNGLSKVMLLRSAEFTWKDDINNKPCVGLIAQDVQVVLPEAVNTTTKYNSNDKTEYLGISYNETIPLLVAAIKEQQALIAQLTAKVTALEAK